MNSILEGGGYCKCCKLALTVMLIIAAALYSEAKPFIDYLALKKDTSCHHCQVFRNKDTALYLTGTGPMNAAIKSAVFLATEPVADTDYFLNIGVCGAATEKERNNILLGTPVLCNKIIEHASGNTYYPDVLYKHPFQEGTVISSYQFMTWEMVNAYFKDISPPLRNTGLSSMFFADMESSALYQSVSCFFKLNRMFFIKVVSDYISPAAAEQRLVASEDVSNLLKEQVGNILNWLEDIMASTPGRPAEFSEDELHYLTALSEDFKFSVTMANELKQYLRYYKLQKGEFIPFTEILRENIPRSVKSKAEGKKYLDYFKKNLL